MSTSDLFQDVETFSLSTYPKTRFQGSKRKLLRHLALAFDTCPNNLALDLFSGSGIVTLLLRDLGYRVISNDYLKFSNNTSHVFLEVTNSILDNTNWENILDDVLHKKTLKFDPLVSKHYENIFFTNDENCQIDRFCQNVENYEDIERKVLIYAVGQSLLKKRPYNLFHRANLNMRLKTVKRSFGNAVTWEKSIYHHAILTINELKKHNFTNSNSHKVTNRNSNDLINTKLNPNLIYLDPPYIASNSKSINYSDFYNFLEGLVDYKLFKTSAKDSAHRPIVNYTSNWDAPSSAIDELKDIVYKWPDSAIVFSYRDDGQPSVDSLIKVLSLNNRSTKLLTLEKYKYALSHSNSTHEIIIISNPSDNNKSL
tara:strand:- start:284 stop:1390 length:1107 start_codon:yes stop_codon:yes gene_type:complete